MHIKNHKLVGHWHRLSRDIGAELDAPRFIVMHYTAGGAGAASRDYMLKSPTQKQRLLGADRKIYASAHVVVDRDGSIWQIVPFNRKARHAGRSSWKGLESLNGYAVGIDLTRRDLQLAAKESRGTWDTAKGFDQSAPISDLHRAGEIGHPDSGGIWLSVNGEIRQNADLNELIWSVPEAIAELSTFFALVPGDLIFTGTPAGVGPLEAGDKVTGGIDGIDEIAITIGNKQ